MKPVCVHWIISHGLDKFVKQKQEDSYLRKILILKIPLLLFREIKRFSFPCFRPADGRSGWGGSVSSTKRWTGKTRRGVRVNPPGRPRVPPGLRTRRRTSASGPPTTRSGTSGSTGEGRRCCTLRGRKKNTEKNSPTYLHFSTFSRKISDIEQDILNFVFILFVSRSGYPVTLPRAMSDPQNPAAHPAAHPVNPDRCDFLFSTGRWTEKSLREEWSGLFQHILHRQQQQQQQQQQSLLESERDSIRRRNNSKHVIVPERRRGKKKKKVAPRRKSKGKQKNAMITKSSRKGSSMDGTGDSSVGWRRRRRRRKHRRQKQQQQQQRRRRPRRPRRQRSKSS